MTSAGVENPRKSLSSAGEQTKHLWPETEVQLTASVREVVASMEMSRKGGDGIRV